MRSFPVRAAALLVAFSALWPAAAGAEVAPCWQRLLEDWQADGRIDRTYPTSCYRSAVANLPEDLRQYSSASDDISRAMRLALASRPRSTRPPPDPPAAPRRVAAVPPAEPRAAPAARKPPPSPPVEQLRPARQAARAPEPTAALAGPRAAPLPLLLLALVGAALVVSALGRVLLSRRRQRG